MSLNDDIINHWILMDEINEDAPPVARTAKLTRRSFLKHSVVATAVATGLIPQTEAHAQEADIISIERLSELGVTIFDLPEKRYPDSFVELNFRQSAMDTALFKQLESGRKSLTIVLLDNVSVNPEKLDKTQLAALQDKQYVLNSIQREIQKVRDSGREKIRELRPAKVAQYETEMSELNARIQNMEISQDEYIVRANILKYLYEPYISEDDYITDKMVDSHMGTIRGTTVTIPASEGKRAEVMVFMAVRNPEKTKHFQSGEFALTIESIESMRDLELQPHPHQSFPTVDSLNYVDRGSEEYGIDTRTPGIILRHELGHGEGYMLEGETDSQVVSDIRKAQEKNESGDSKGYWIVFRTPKGYTFTANPADNLI